MRYTFLLSTLSVAAFTGCASSGDPTIGNAPEPVQTTRIVGNGGSTEMRTSPGVGRGVVMVEGSLASVWQSLAAAYDSVGLTITTSSPGQGILGTESFKIRRKLKDVPLTRYIDCGNTQGGPSAETYEILLTVMTQLQPTADGTRATTILQASGRPISLGGSYMTCGSTGRLEERIGELIGGVPPR
jgi:hypothetical protein